jgi:acyl-CoA synthetase (AMP-forming)/AMP-acid ligase II/acyl carrier protein
MTDNSMYRPKPPPEQEAIRAKCFHPSGTFVEFKEEEIEQSIPERFEKIVRKYPDRIAVKTGRHIVTFAQLDAAATRVARTVVAERGKISEPIGVLVEPGSEQIATMLGILKAGKFIALLDPLFPDLRIGQILDNSQAKLVITNQEISSQTREFISRAVRVIELESIDLKLPSDNLNLRISPNALALIAYTSGSTGHPKGVVWNHRGLMHIAMQATNAFHICSDDKITLLTNGTVNTIANILAAALTGAALLPFSAQKEGLNQLASWLSREAISICWISSPLFRGLCESLTGEEQFPDLRLIRLASEATHKSDVVSFKKTFPPNSLMVNGLATSEAGFLTMNFIDHSSEIAASEAPLGFALEDKEISLLDDTGNTLGFKQVGEITVRSPFLSQGYWGQPDATEAKFKAEPSGTHQLHYTGDLALMLPNGCLLYKGRKDFRVKIRGYAVEIEEVERALLKHAAIKETIVLPRDANMGETRLLAYYTIFGQLRPSTQELRNFLKERLPDYMIPSTFVWLDALPLTPGGKINRKVLPDPGNARPELNTPYAVPRTPIEERLAQIWAQVLFLNQVGIQDNFFDLGGHSLVATRVISEISKTFQLELPIQTLFYSPTVADMAAAITEHQKMKLREQELDRLLTELESLSEEEAERLVSGTSEAGSTRSQND